MKISELVGYLNQLKQEYATPDYTGALLKLDSLAHLTQNHNVQFAEFSLELKNLFDTTKSNIAEIENLMSELQNKINGIIKSLESAQFAETERWYYEEEVMTSPAYILNRRMRIDDDSNLILRGRLKTYTDWRVPGMIIRPGLESFVEELVPLDPLYLVDQDTELLEPVLSAFNEQYRRRLRPYVIDDGKYENPLWQLPDQQFGLIFAWNFFNFKPLSIIERYLIDFYQKLRPGGLAIFTFNDCDIELHARLAESNFMSYAPGSSVRHCAEKIGFDIVYYHHGKGDVVWLEIQKPGKIESIRGGQALAKIVAH